MLDLLISTVGQGLQWSVLALGVFLTFRILDIADLSVEGSFPLGAAAAATAITSGLGLPAAFVLGLVISNALVALSGATVAQANGFADVGMGVGTIVIGLASVIIGEVLFSPKSFKTSLIAVILGSIVYRLVIAFVLEMGMPPNDLKLFTAVLVAFALALPLIKEKCAGLRAHG